MKNKRLNSRQRRVIISVIIFIVIVVIFLIANPDGPEIKSFNILNIIVAIVLAVSAAQPVIGVVDAILDFLERRNEQEISSDLRDTILANQYRVWIDGILKKSIENDPLIVPYEEILIPGHGKNNKSGKFHFENDISFGEKIQTLLTAKTVSRRKSGPSSTEIYKRIEDAFVASSGQLAILGEGGSGKTIALLQLFQYLHDDAQKDSKQHIPVVLNLGSWEEKQLNLTDWFVSEILDSFKGELPEGLSKALAHEVKRRRMIFLFDGFDEVSKSGRETFYKELQKFSEKVKGHSLQVVICSRPKEYTEAQVGNSQLNLKAILLRPIDDEAIMNFLGGDEYEKLRKIIFGLDDKAVKRLINARNPKPIQDKIRNSQKLYEPAHHPFILNALAVGYKNPPENEMALLERALQEHSNMLEGDGLHPIPDVVLERYVSQRFDSAEIADYEIYSEETTNVYLSWIAQKLHNTVEFGQENAGKKTEISMENLQPTWLDNAYWRLAYTIVSRMLSTIAIIAGLGFFLASPLDYLLPGVIAGVTIGVLDYITAMQPLKKFSDRIGEGWFRFLRLLTVYFACSITLSIPLGLFTPAPVEDKIFFGNLSITLSGITLSWFLSLFIAVIFITRDIRLKFVDIEPAELIRFEIGTMIRYAAIGGVSIGAFIGIFAQILFAQKTGSTSLWLREIIHTLGVGWMGPALIGFLVGAFFGGLFAGIFGLLSVSSLEERTRPNQGIQKSIQNAIQVGVSLTVVFSSIFIIFLWVRYHDIDVVYRGLRDGLTIGVLGGLWSGGISTIHHMVLRFFLFASGGIPLNFSHFLHYCSQINIMREIGASYIFGHDYVKLHYYQQKAPASQPRWSYVMGALGIFILTFGIGSLRQLINTAIYSFDDPLQYLVGEETPLDTNSCIRAGERYEIKSQGVIRAGDYVGYITPEGTEIGFWGLGVGDAFDLVQNLPNNALICKLDTEAEWHLCAERPGSVFPMPWETRMASFTAQKDGCLQFDINEKEREKRKGSFFVLVTTRP